MQKLLIIIATLAFATNSFAVVKTPVGRKPVRHQHESQETKTRIGWYIAPVLKIGEIHSEIRPMIGIRGGIEINRSFYIGIAGYGLVRPKHYETRQLEFHNYFDYDNKWDMGYGGLEFGVMVGRPQTGQLALGALVGGGATDFYDRGYSYDYYEEREFFVFEPQLDLSASVARNVRFSVGGSYRFVDYVDDLRYPQTDLDGPSFNVAIAFGLF